MDKENIIKDLENIILRMKKINEKPINGLHKNFGKRIDLK